MGVTVRQKVKGKGKPWRVFIAHNGKRKSIKVGDRTVAGATLAGGCFKIDGRVSSYGSLFSHGTDGHSHDNEKEPWDRKGNNHADFHDAHGSHDTLHTYNAGCASGQPEPFFA